MSKINKCRYCGKILTYQKKYCSNLCRAKDISVFKDSKVQRALSLRAHKKYPLLAKYAASFAVLKNKKNKTGLYDNKINYLGNKFQKEHNLGLFNDNIRKNAIKKAQNTLKRENKSFYNSDVQRDLSKRAHLKHPELGITWGFNTIRYLRHNIRNLKYKGQYYDSIPEAGVAMSIQNQFNYIPKERKTLHIRIRKCEYDYLIEDLKLFIEFHPFDLQKTDKEYYKKRRDILDNNGYEDYNLLVIK